MIKRLSFIRILCLLMIFSSCSTVNMRIDGRKDRRPIIEKKNFYLAGLIGEHTLIMKDYCPKGVAEIEEQFTPSDVLLSIITLSIYSPRHTSIYCRL